MILNNVRTGSKLLNFTFGKLSMCIGANNDQIPIRAIKGKYDKLRVINATLCQILGKRC